MFFVTKIRKLGSMKNIDLCENGKIKKGSKIHNSNDPMMTPMIVETSGWRHLKEKNWFLLSCEYQKM